MSMLAERKRKTKWVINPTKKPLWTTDPNGIKFGKGLMEKMGWSAGKGLGANEQGIQEPLKVSYKNDTKGMGFKGNDDDWIEHQDEFNCFLNQLRNCDESYVVRISDAEKNEVKSLEEKSKWSKARVHYQKFTRGKDLSKYSENDLACILGTNKTKNEKSKVEEVLQPEPNINNNMETHFGVTTINSGSIQDYFKKKWIFHKKTKGEEGDGETVQNENSYFSTHENDNCEVKDEKKSKRKKLKLSPEEYVETVITPSSDDLEKLKKKKNKKKREREMDSEEETENKRKKNDFDLINGFSEDVSIELKNKKKKELNDNNDDCELEKFTSKEESVFESTNEKEEEELKVQKKKKKKKDKEKLKNEGLNCYENGVGNEEKHEYFEAETILKKKKKSKKEKHLDSSEEGKVSCDISDTTNQSDAEVIESCSVVKKKKKKKDRKEKSVEEEEVEGCCNVNVENFVEGNETEFSLEWATKQTKKNSKKEKHLDSSEEGKKSCDISDTTNQSNAEVVESCSVGKKKKKKKDRKEKSVEEEVEDCCNVNVENFIEANETEFSSEWVTKQTKKKDIEEKIEFVANTIQSLEQENKNDSLVEASSEVESIRKKKKKKKDKADVECLPEVEVNRKKSKKKESENLKNSERDMNNCLEEDKKRQALLENEPVRKKMKKSKKDRSSSKLEDVEVTENNSETTGALEITTKVESGKKKKDKKEKIEFADSDTVKITDTSELTGDKKKKKKKKEKDKTKEISSDYTETQKSEFCLEENNPEESNTQKEKLEKKNVIDNSGEAKKSEDKDIEKTDIVNDKKLEFSTNKNYNYGYNKNITNFPLISLDYSNNSYNSQFLNSGVLHQQQQNVSIANVFNFLYSYNYFNNVLNAQNWNVNNENAIQSHKIEFLDAKMPDKFYPGQDRREKILRLIHLSDFAEFKGSNLEKLPGYGFLKEKIFNKPA